MKGQDIKTLRKKLGLSQRKFAKQLGVSHTILRFWESGKKSPSNDCNCDFASFLSAS
jgi:DNA-binding transcriptional regulator YiaG